MTSKPIARPRDIIGHKGDKDRAEMQVCSLRGMGPKRPPRRWIAQMPPCIQDVGRWLPGPKSYYTGPASRISFSAPESESSSPPILRWAHPQMKNEIRTLLRSAQSLADSVRMAGPTCAAAIHEVLVLCPGPCGLQRAPGCHPGEGGGGWCQAGAGNEGRPMHTRRVHAAARPRDTK